MGGRLSLTPVLTSIFPSKMGSFKSLRKTLRQVTLPRVTKRPGRGGLGLCSHPVLWVPAGRRAPRRGWGGSSVGRQGPRNPGHWDLSSYSISTVCCLKALWQMSSLALGLPWDRTTILSPVELRGTLTQGHGRFKSSLICSYEEDQNKTLARQTSETLRILSKVIHQPGTRTSHVGGARLAGRGRGVGCSWGPAATGGSTEAGRSADFGARAGPPSVERGRRCCGQAQGTTLPPAPLLSPFGGFAPGVEKVLGWEPGRLRPG